MLLDCEDDDKCVSYIIGFVFRNSFWQDIVFKFSGSTNILITLLSLSLSCYPLCGTQKDGLRILMEKTNPKKLPLVSCKLGL